MPNPFRRSVLLRADRPTAVLFLCLLSLGALPAIGQDTKAPPTALEKQLDKVDFGISAQGILTDTVSGTNYLGVAFTEKGSNTVGELVTLRYTAKPYVGFEFNFGNARFSENFANFKPCPPTPYCNYLAGAAQNDFREYTLGYIAHPRKILGVQPFLGAGGGTLHFKPTPYGGQGLEPWYRAVYYYTAGAEGNFPDSHFGMRLGFRQLIYLAPDFGQNYLTITRRARTTEPTVGFFVRF